MASRAELARALAQLKTAPGWRDYVKTLQVHRDDIIISLLHESDPSKVEALRGEARAYDTLFNDVIKNVEAS